PLFSPLPSPLPSLPTLYRVGLDLAKLPVPPFPPPPPLLPDLPSHAGMIEELLDSSLQERQHADLVDARACAGETIDLINRVLDLAKLQAGKLQLETLPCYLRRIVREAAEVGAPTVTGKESASDFHVDESVPETLIGDPSRLLQVMAELVGEWLATQV
ncbi:unnamed protein product, partial [Closterium sp. NIES-53]